MSKARRDLKRMAAHAYNDQERALYNLKLLHDQFKEYHPEHTDLIESLAAGCMVVQDGIRRLWEVSWGSPPEDIAGYKG